MAEITDTLRLDIDQALRDVDRVESALDQLSVRPIEIEVDTSEVEHLEEVTREVQRIAERAATEVQSIALAAGKAEVNFEDMARALDITEDEARRLTTELLQSQAASNKVEDAARDIARQLGLSDSEADRLTRSLKNADTAAESINVKTVSMVSSFGSLKTAAAGIASAFAVIGGAQLFAGILRGANAAVQQFAQLEDSVNAVNVIFGNASQAVLDFGETAARSAGLSESAFNQAVTPLGALLQNFGFDAREAADASVILVQRAADLASVLGGDVQTALAAVSSALRGQSEPLTAYGATISAARVEQFALANGLAATKAEITDAITLQARYGLILEDTNRVAGDYAATAGDLANAQRTAAGEATNVASAFGEALAPAFEAVLVQAVPMLNFFESLAPALGDTATEASGAAAGLTEFVSGVVLGFGQLADTAGGVVDVLQVVPAAIEDIAAGIAGDGSFAEVNAQLDEFSQRVANSFIRIASQSIPAAVAKGDSAVNAFGKSIAFLAQQDDGLQTIQQAFERLSIQAGLTDPELQAVTQSLIAQAGVLGFTAEEVEFLQSQLNVLNEVLGDGGRANADYLASINGIGEGFSTATTTFTTFAGATETSQERASAALAELAADAEAQAQRAEAAFNLFADAPDKITESFTSAVDDLREQVEQMAGFEANLALLAAEGLDALVAEFRTQGPAAATQVVQALNDLDLAREADQLLQGIPGPAIDAFGEEFVQELVNRGLTQTAAEALAATLNSPAVIDAVTEAGNQSAVAGVTAYGVGIEAEMATFAAETDFANLLAGALTNEALLQALADAGAAGAQAYEDGFRGPRGLNADSPSKTFMEIGKDAVDGFILGWDQNALTLKVPSVPTGGIINTGTETGGVGGAAAGSGVNVTLITNNPTQQDEVSDVARMGQIASSIASTYRSVT